jgi:hypothetical protein
MDGKPIYATTQPPRLKLLSASMGVEGAGTGSDSGLPETMEASEAKKSMDPDENEWPRMKSCRAAEDKPE